jgi:NAD(P)-dependent dehydrogenase (short-subunit alcohol dehydrogenase family)
MERDTVIITGGTSGIGLATARRFLARGWNVAICGRSKERGAAALEELLRIGEAKNILFIQMNVASVAECAQAAKRAADFFGNISALVNSAGIYFEKAIEDMQEEDFDEIMNTNIKGTYFMCRECVPHLKKRGRGAIVNVSSDAGLNGNFFCSAYCASKGAVTVFTKALALELAPYNINVNCVCPGDIDTPLTRRQLTAGNEAAELSEMKRLSPAGRIGTADEVARVIEFLAIEAGFVAGAAWCVDGGLTAY